MDMLTNYFVKFIWLSLLTIVILADPSINDDENPSEEQSTNNSLESDPIDVQMLADETAFFYVYLM